MSPRLVVAAAAAVVAIASVAAGWLDDAPDLTAADAVDATQDAFDAAGLDASVDTDPVRATYDSRTHDRVEVWSVLATVRDEPVELQIARSGAHPMFIDDRTLDHTAFVLSRVEYEAVAGHVDDPALARTVRRNIALTFAAVLVVALSIAHAAIATTPKETTGGAPPMTPSAPTCSPTAAAPGPSR